MGQEWFYSKGGTRFGPVAASKLRELAGADELQPDDLVWTSGLAEWKPARSVKGLFRGEVSRTTKPPLLVPQSPHATSTTPEPGPHSTPTPIPPMLLPPQQSDAPGGKLPSRVGRLVPPTLSFCKAVLKEVWDTAVTTAMHVTRLSWCGFLICRGVILHRAAIKAQLALGDRVHRLGMRDQMDKQLPGQVSPSPSPDETPKHNAEQKTLLMQLAEPILSQGSPPSGAEVEYQKAQLAVEALRRNRERLDVARTGIRPAGRVGGRRLLIGYATSLFLLWLIFLRPVGLLPTNGFFPSSLTAQGRAGAISARDLYSEFQGERTAFLQRYEGKRVTVVGELHSARSDYVRQPDDPARCYTIFLRTGKRSQSIECAFLGQEAKKAEATSGKQYVICGTVKDGGVAIDLTDCQLVEASATVAIARRMKPPSSREIKVSIGTPGIGHMAGWIRGMNQGLKSARAYATDSQLVIDFDVDDAGWKPVNQIYPLIIRLFDKNTQYLTHFTTTEGFTVYGQAFDNYEQIYRRVSASVRNPEQHGAQAGTARGLRQSARL